MFHPSTVVFVCVKGELKGDANIGIISIHKLYRSEYPHLVLVNPTISPKSLKHFLQRRRSYLRMRPVWHLHLLHSRLSLPNLRGWVLQRRLGISGKIKYYYLYKIQQ